MYKKVKKTKIRGRLTYRGRLGKFGRLIVAHFHPNGTDRVTLRSFNLFIHGARGGY
jgi:hypothetical protein